MLCLWIYFCVCVYVIINLTIQLLSKVCTDIYLTYSVTFLTFLWEERLLYINLSLDVIYNIMFILDSHFKSCSCAYIYITWLYDIIFYFTFPQSLNGVNIYFSMQFFHIEVKLYFHIVLICLFFLGVFYLISNMIWSESIYVSRSGAKYGAHPQWSF